MVLQGSTESQVLSEVLLLSPSVSLLTLGRLTCTSEYSAISSRKLLHRFLELLLYFASYPLISVLEITAASDSLLLNLSLLGSGGLP